MNLKQSTLIFFILFLFSINPLSSQNIKIQLDSTELEISVLMSDLTIPWDLNWGADGWIWFNERKGTINRLNPQTGDLQLVHQIPDVYQSADNSGFHAFALHPDFPQIPYVYAHYTYHSDTSKLVRYTYLPTFDTLGQSVILLDDILASDSHNGSRIVFSDDDKLFLCIGDAYRGSTPQDLQYMNGKILRINLDGTIPDDNPLPGNPAWTWGHRNPQGLVFARGILYSSEHGGGEDDELNIIKKGHNYGWPEVHGYCNWASEVAFCADSGVTEPIKTWTPTYAPAGLAYYDHAAIPEWRHSLLQVFLKSGGGGVGQRMQQLKLNDAGDSIIATNNFFTNTFGRLRDVLVGPDGRVFVCTSNRETNGAGVVKDDDDKIIEIRNPEYPTVSRPDNPLKSIKIFPNPAQDELYVTLPFKQGRIQLTIVDMLGRELTKQDYVLSGYTISLNRGDIHDGNYMVKVDWMGKGIVWERVVFR